MTDIKVHLQMQDAPEAAAMIVLMSDTSVSPIRVEVQTQGWEPSPDGAVAVAQAMQDVVATLVSQIDANTVEDNTARDWLLRTRQTATFESNIASKLLDAARASGMRVDDVPVVSPDPVIAPRRPRFNPK